MEHQAVKDNAVKQRVRAKCRFCENSFCSSIQYLLIDQERKL
jgi:hypothetical protein